MTDSASKAAALSFAAVPIRYEVAVDLTGEHIAVVCGDHTGASRVKIGSRSSADVVTLEGELGTPHFVNGVLAVASTTTTTEVPGGRWVSIVSLAPGKLGQRLRQIDTRELGLGDWVKLTAARDDQLVLVGKETIVVCDLEGAVRARVAFLR